MLRLQNPLFAPWPSGTEKYYGVPPVEFVDVELVPVPEPVPVPRLVDPPLDELDEVMLGVELGILLTELLLEPVVVSY